jgi:hypothetical protein
MTRDFDLIRKLLLYFDHKPDYSYAPVPSMEPEYTPDQVKHHCLLLYQAGFLDAETERSQGGRVINTYPLGLTWDGHEFLAKIRSEGVWQKAKTVTLEKAGALSFAALNQIVTRFAAELLK